MLNYLITVTEDLLIAVTLLVLIWNLCRMIHGEKAKKILTAGVTCSVLASAAMSVAKNTTSKMATNRWNLWIFLITTVVSVLFVIVSLIFANGRAKGKVASGAVTVSVSGAVLIALLLFYELPDVMAYPFVFDVGDAGVLSVAFLLRFLGWLFALLLLLVFGVYLNRSIRALNRMHVILWVTVFAVLVNAARCLGQSLRAWTSRAKWLPGFLPKYEKADYPWAFPVVKYVANHTLLFTVLVTGAALLIPVLLFIQNTKVTGTYENPAQLRRLRAIGRKNRHAATTVAVCFALSVTILTAVKAYANRTVELSSPEEYQVEGDQILIPVSQFEDGHLHRYEYTTDNNIAVRWIVIKKPGSASYGVGLDACEVCGDAGYYERGDQVVCKRCDVVMNIQTIGFRGGCNPIPLAYQVQDGQMIFALQDIIDGEKEFK